jgi:hypothetical protein
VLELADDAYVELAVLDGHGRIAVTIPTTFELVAADIFP